MAIPRRSPEGWSPLVRAGFAPGCRSSLASTAQCTYVTRADGKTSGCVAFSLPVQRRSFRLADKADDWPRYSEPRVFAAPPRACAVRGRREWRLKSPSRYPVPGVVFPGAGSSASPPAIVAIGGDATASERFDVARAPPVPNTAANAADCSRGPTHDAPVESAHPRQSRAAAPRCFRASQSAGRGFGKASRNAFRPFHYPRIRWTLPIPGRARRASRPARLPPARVLSCPTRC